MLRGGRRESAAMDQVAETGVWVRSRLRLQFLSPRRYLKESGPSINPASSLLPRGLCSATPEEPFQSVPAGLSWLKYHSWTDSCHWLW